MNDNKEITDLPLCEAFYYARKLVYMLPYSKEKQ
jgi:hypothetical protein